MVEARLYLKVGYLVKRATIPDTSTLTLGAVGAWGFVPDPSAMAGPCIPPVLFSIDTMLLQLSHQLLRMRRRTPPLQTLQLPLLRERTGALPCSHLSVR